MGIANCNRRSNRLSTIIAMTRRLFTIYCTLTSYAAQPARQSISENWNAMLDLCRGCMNTTSFSGWERCDEQSNRATAGSNDQGPLQDPAHANDWFSIQYIGRAGDSRKEEPYRISRSLVAGRS